MKTNFRTPFSRFKMPFVLALVLVFSGIQPSAADTAAEKQAIAQLQNLNTAFTAIAKKVTPSVVTIKTRKTAKQTQQETPEFHFFGRPFRMPRPDDRDAEGTGSGIVMTEDGYILTNHHVAGEADAITVVFSDNREYEAKLIGSDSRTDVAVVKIDAQGLKPALSGQSDQVQIGEWVLAIGAPLDLQSTVTAGIVSAIGRDINIFRDSFGVEDFIQTDAAINPGNSGGALVNLYGKVIGVNTAIATRTGNFVGYGFAIPIDLARKVMDDIIAHGEVKRGFLGVSLEAVNAGEAEAFGLDRPQGVLIAQVFSDTPAEAAGLNSGDIILKVDGQTVNRPNQVQSLIARKHPGDTVNLDLRRRTENIRINATLGENIPDDMRTVASTQRPQSAEEATELGLTVTNITPELAQSLGLDEDLLGVIVTNVGRGPARDAGFQERDIIFAVLQGGFEQDITSARDFADALANLKKGQHAAFYIMRGNSRSYITPKIPE